MQPARVTQACMLPAHCRPSSRGVGCAPRVIGQRLMDGLAVCSLKSAVVEAGLVSYADFAPGSIAGGTVESVEDFGMFVKLAPGVKCALRAASFDVFAFFCCAHQHQCRQFSSCTVLLMESSRKGRC